MNIRRLIRVGVYFLIFIFENQNKITIFVSVYWIEPLREMKSKEIIEALAADVERLMKLHSAAMEEIATLREQSNEQSAKIRSLRKPEPYKGKGIRFAGEIVRRKSGKSAGAK